jgi:hypothetical protein
MAMDSTTFTAPLERDKDGTWWYVHVPAEVRAGWKRLERRGFIAVTATVGGSRWTASLMPWADGSAQLVIKRPVREREGLRLGSDVTVTLTAGLIPIGPTPGPTPDR